MYIISFSSCFFNLTNNTEFIKVMNSTHTLVKFVLFG